MTIATVRPLPAAPHRDLRGLLFDLEGPITEIEGLAAVAEAMSTTTAPIQGDAFAYLVGALRQNVQALNRGWTALHDAWPRPEGAADGTP
jgi:hypothetical protein